jgi:dienelactone hydrolase
LHTELIYEADGLRMVSHLFMDDTRPGPLPGVLVFPEAFGLGAHAKSRAEKLSALGYAALACDLHGEEKLIPDLDEVMPIIGALRDDVDRIRARALAGLHALTAHDQVDVFRIAAIGYCFGGTMALELARSGADIAAVAGFHCGLATKKPGDAKNIKGHVLVCIGADDPSIGPDQRGAFEAEMHGGGVEYQMHLYGGVVHSFTNPEADAMKRPDFARYDGRADSRSWAAMMGLFEEVMGRN